MLTHLDDNTNPSMVDISTKSATVRTACAQAEVQLPNSILEFERDKEIFSKKGPVFQTAIIAGTMAVKRTAEIIPFCHPLPLDSIKFDISMDQEAQVTILCTVKTEYKTGVEMEAIHGASAAALTIYDMCKAYSQDIQIKEIKLLEKTGGKSDFKTGEKVHEKPN